LFPPRAFPDPQALRGPRPETELPEQRAIQHGYNPVGFRDIPGVTPPNNLVAESGVGTVSIVISTPTTEAPRFDSTSITLDSTTDTFDEG